MKIAGAGLSGSLLAYLLARDGFKVEVWERRRMGEVKPCGGGIVKRAWNILKPLRPEGVRIHRVVAEYSGKRIEFERRDLALSADMGELVNNLREMAESQGAVIHYGKGISSGFDIDARGARDASVLGMEGISNNGIEDTLYFKILDFNPPVKYLWKFPKTEGFSVGVAGPSSWVVESGEAYLRRMGAGKWRVHPIPIFNGNLNLDVKRLGDAANLVDPLNYEGITGAVVSSIRAWKHLNGEGMDISEFMDFLKGEWRIYRSLRNSILRAIFTNRKFVEKWLDVVYRDFSPRTASSLRI